MTPTPFPALRLSMGVGAAYDLLTGATIALLLEPLSRVLPIPFPAEPLYARLCGVLICGLGLFYLFAFLAIDRFLRNVAGAIAVRTAGGLFLIGYVTGVGGPGFLAVFGGIDLAFALWHLALLRLEARLPFWPLLVRGDSAGGAR